MNAVLVSILCALGMAQAHTALPPIQRLEKASLSTSIVIPCCGKHFQHLQELLEYYTDQSELPDEVVISLSDAEKIDPNALAMLLGRFWPFTLKIISKKGKESAGGNRNIAVAHCTKDIILFQDADDVPHPQRVELVKSVFEHYHVDHLMHLWLGPQCRFESYIPEKLELIHHSEHASHVQDIYMKIQGWDCTVHNGNICLMRELASKHLWESVFGYDKDVEYNIFLYQLPIRTAVLAAPLLIYRNELSSFRD